MRCTSSDLIIGAPVRGQAGPTAPPARARSRKARDFSDNIMPPSEGLERNRDPTQSHFALVRGWRVPKRQESVKVETLDRLDRTPLLEAARERPEPHRVAAGHD